MFCFPISRHCIKLLVEKKTLFGRKKLKKNVSPHKYKLKPIRDMIVETEQPIRSQEIWKNSSIGPEKAEISKRED